MVNLIRFFAVNSLLLIFAVCASNVRAEDRETTYRERALAAAAVYEKPSLYLYAPHSDPTERSASAAAATAHIFVLAYGLDPSQHWIDHAKDSANSIIAHSDMNGDGKVGWGRYWKVSGDSGDDKGGNTAFSRGCKAPRNRAYQDEMYDNAVITHFLLNLYKITNDQKYLNSAKSAIDDTWAVGSDTDGGKGYSYFKTTGQCDAGWQAKNVNMLMGTSVALLANATHDEKYIDRLQKILHEETSQVLSRNFGYYNSDTVKSKSAIGGYVGLAQTERPGDGTRCNLATLSGEGCSSHIGLEARALMLVGRALGSDDKFRPEIEALMDGYLADDPQLCQSERTKLGAPRDGTACSAYYCALRKMRTAYDDLCFQRVTTWAKPSQDVVLGLFWGGDGR